MATQIIVADGIVTRSASAKQAFFGSTPTAQPAATNQAAVLTSPAVSVSATQWGFATSAQANGLVTLVNQLRSDLVSLGLIKGSN